MYVKDGEVLYLRHALHCSTAVIKYHTCWLKFLTPMIPEVGGASITPLPDFGFDKTLMEGTGPAQDSGLGYLRRRGLGVVIKHCK